MPECRSFHYALPASLLTRSPGATHCIFNQGMSALTPSCYRYTLHASLQNSNNGITTLHVAIHCTRTRRSSFCRMHLFVFWCLWKCDVCIRLNCDQLCPMWRVYASVTALIAKDKPIAANKRAAELPEGKNIISPPLVFVSLQSLTCLNSEMKFPLSPFMP